MTCDRLHDWLSDGAYGFASAAGAGLVQALHQLAEVLPCPRIIQCTESEQYSIGTEWDEVGLPSSFIMSAQARLLNGFLR